MCRRDGTTVSACSSTALSSSASSTATATDPPSPSMSRATALRFSRVRPARRTCAPSRANARATPPSFLRLHAFVFASDSHDVSCLTLILHCMGMREIHTCVYQRENRTVKTSSLFLKGSANWRASHVTKSRWDGFRIARSEGWRERKVASYLRKLYVLRARLYSPWWLGSTSESL
jgi:hypothetical protein